MSTSVAESIVPATRTPYSMGVDVSNVSPWSSPAAGKPSIAAATGANKRDLTKPPIRESTDGILNAPDPRHNASDESGTAGTLSFMWDDPDPAYAPDDAELVLRLAFASEIGGAFEYTYSEGEDVHPAVEGDFDIVEGQIDGADCEGGQ